MKNTPEALASGVFSCCVLDVLAVLGAGKVRKGAVGLGHTVTIFLLLEGGTLFVVSVNDFSL